MVDVVCAPTFVVMCTVRVEAECAAAAVAVFVATLMEQAEKTFCSFDTCSKN